MELSDLRAAARLLASLPPSARLLGSVRVTLLLETVPPPRWHPAVSRRCGQRSELLEIRSCAMGSGGAAPRPHHHMRKRSQTRMTDHKLRNPHHREEGASMGSGGDLVSYSSWRRRRGTRYAPSLHGTSNRRKRP